MENEYMQLMNDLINQLTTENGIACMLVVAFVDLCLLIIILKAYKEKRINDVRWLHEIRNYNIEYEENLIPLDAAEILIGRHFAADIKLHDASVSRYHAIITFFNGVISIKDLNSKSGIYVNGRKVKYEILRGNDEIKIGNEKLIVRRKRQV